MAGCSKGNDEPVEPWGPPDDAPRLQCAGQAALAAADAPALDTLATSAEGVASLEGPLKSLVCSALAAAGQPLTESPVFMVLPEAEFVAARDSHPAFKGREDVPGFILHDPAAPVGSQAAIIMPSTKPPTEFTDILHHEIGHVREQARGEQEAELAEILQALVVAQLAPRFGMKLLDRVFDVGVSFPPNALGHAKALLLLAEKGGDGVAARAALAGWTNDAGRADLASACGGCDPLAAEAYPQFAEPFVEAVGGFPAVDGASPEAAPADLQAYLRWRYAFALDFVEPGSVDYMETVDATDAYMKGRATPGLLHHEAVRNATKILAATATPVAGSPPATPVRIAHWDRIIALNALYSADDGTADEQYLRAFSATAGWASQDPLDEGAIERVSDTFLARFGATPMDACVRQVGAEVFQRRAGLLFGVQGDACAAKPWFERSQALLGWSEADSCGVAMEGIDGFVAGELEKVAAFDCP